MSETTKTITTGSTRPPSAWPAATACICLAILTAYLLFGVYGVLHWSILAEHYGELSSPLKSKLFTLLNRLEIYHATGFLTPIFAIWAFRGKPRWAAWLAVPFGILGTMLAFVMM